METEEIMTTHEHVRKAFLLAAEYHQHQKYGDHPYLVHLYDVVSVLIEFGHGSHNLLAAAWTHDSLEDTTLNYSKIKSELGQDIAEIVFAVTDELGRSRKERKQKTLPKLTQFEDAQIVKLADWIANLRNCYSERPDLLQMYRKDYRSFKDAVQSEATAAMKPLWDEVEKLIHEGP